MSKYDETWKIVDLQKKCKELSLPYGGRKILLIERLNTFYQNDISNKTCTTTTQSPDNESDTETEAESSSFTENFKDVQVLQLDESSDNESESEQLIENGNSLKRQVSDAAIYII